MFEQDEEPSSQNEFTCLYCLKTLSGISELDAHLLVAHDKSRQDHLLDFGNNGSSGPDDVGNHTDVILPTEEAGLATRRATLWPSSAVLQKPQKAGMTL